MNILSYGLKKAKVCPERWRVVQGLYEAPNKSNVIRNASEGYFPEVLKTVKNSTGEVECTRRSYRNAEISHHNGTFIIDHTCNPTGKVEQVKVQLNTLPEVTAYFREMLPKFASEQYRPIR